MIWKPKRLGRQKIEERELEADKKNCRRFGPCGVGQKALYLNSFYFDRRYYVALDSISRVFKRVAMSKGGFSGKGMFATIPYLVSPFCLCFMKTLYFAAFAGFLVAYRKMARNPAARMIPAGYATAVPSPRHSFA